MKDYDHYLNRQAQVLQEFDNFCDQFEQRAGEQFKNPSRQDERFELLREITDYEQRDGTHISDTREDRSAGSRDKRSQESDTNVSQTEG